MDPKLQAAHDKARAATVKKFGPDYTGEEALNFYNKELAKAQRKDKREKTEKEVK